MTIQALDHVNVRTANVAGLEEFYVNVLGLSVGPRPAFPFGGLWLYAGRHAVVHLVQVPEAPHFDGTPRIEHFAFSAHGLRGFLERLADRGVPYRLGRIEDFGILQVNVHDPDGNRVHVDFPLSEGNDLAF
jgi:catechol 2,3-dioxygenase-like lactoylglutathione lyase family enzyme